VSPWHVAVDETNVDAVAMAVPAAVDPLPPEAGEEASGWWRIDVGGCKITRVRQASEFKHTHILTGVNATSDAHLIM